MIEPSNSGPGAYSPALTGLRGLAVLGVFGFHYQYLNPDLLEALDVPLLGPALVGMLQMGFNGVDLFFVLSGFLLTLPFAAARLSGNPAPHTGRYFRRRIARVFPAYYAQLGILLLGGAWFIEWRPLTGLDWPAHLAMAFNLGPNGVRPMVGVWWTLSVELGFYLLLPLLAWFISPRRWLLLLLAAALLSVAWRYAAVASAPDPLALFAIATHLPGNLPEFLAGATAAIWIQRRRIEQPQSSPDPLHAELLFLLGALAAMGWLGFGVLQVADEFWSGHWVMLVHPLVLGSSLAAMVAGAYLGSRVATALLANRLVTSLGLISYSVYLWHFTVMQQLEKSLGGHLEALGLLGKGLAVSACVLLVSVLSYFLFERPFHRIRGR